MNSLLYKNVALKNGKAASLSWFGRDDIDEVVEVLNSVIHENKYLLMNQDVGRSDSEKYLDDGNTKGMRYLVARVDGKVAGGASIIPGANKEAHVVQFGIFVHKNYRNNGLGTILITELTEVARKSGFEIIQLSVFSTNKRAMHVYQKCGFKECGKLTCDIKYENGTYADRIMMELFLTS